MEDRLSLAGWFEGETGERRLGVGEVLFREGDAGDAMYVVRSGQLEIVVGDHVVAAVAPEEVCGEIALIEDAPRSATVRASADSVVVPLTRKKFQFLLQENPWFAIHVMRIMADRLRAMNARR